MKKSRTPLSAPTIPKWQLSAAGLTGASTAYHLARRGIAATIFEAGRVGDGASGRTGGLVLEGTAAGPLEEVSSNIAELNSSLRQRGLIAACASPDVGKSRTGRAGTRCRCRGMTTASRCISPQPSRAESSSLRAC